MSGLFVRFVRHSFHLHSPKPLHRMYGIVVYFEFGFGLRKIDRLVRYEAITLEEMRGYLPATQASKELDEDLAFRESQEQHPNSVLLWVWFTNVHKVAAYSEEAAAMDDADSDGEGDSKSGDDYGFDDGDFGF